MSGFPILSGDAFDRMQLFLNLFELYKKLPGVEEWRARKMAADGVEEAFKQAKS